MTQKTTRTVGEKLPAELRTALGILPKEEIMQTVAKLLLSTKVIYDLAFDINDPKMNRFLLQGFEKLMYNVNKTMFNLQFPEESKLDGDVKALLRGEAEETRLFSEQNPPHMPANALMVVRAADRLLKESLQLNINTCGLKVDLSGTEMMTLISQVNAIAHYKDVLAARVEEAEA